LKLSPSGMGDPTNHGGGRARECEGCARASAAAGQLPIGRHAVERLPSDERGKPAHLIPIRFVPTNKISKDAKLLLAFDALTLSQMIGEDVALGRIIHGDNHATLNVTTSALWIETSSDKLK